MANIKIKKSNRTENNDKVNKIARECGCSEKQVRNILAGISGNKRVTALSEAVMVSYRLLLEGENNALLKIRQFNKLRVKQAS